MLNGKNILITGGTGSFGKKFTEIVLKRYPGIQKIVLFSRDTQKQQKMAGLFSDPRLHFIAGDMGNREEVLNACKDIDLIVHTAALRIVSEAEQHPGACIRTNILGAEYLIEGALKNHVGSILVLSTDMASLANNTYGASKMLAEKLFIDAYREHPELKATIVRYGNMLGSTGTVIPFFRKKAKEDGILPVTDPRMTRFMTTLEDCVNIALRILSHHLGGEIIAPKLKSYYILTLAKAVDPQAKIEIVGLRPGEKLYEQMVTRYESFHTLESDSAYIILPSDSNKQHYCEYYRAHPVPIGFEFTSENNPLKFSEEEIRKLIRESGL